jgi:predicted lipid-binding transport protein (Tim44 family)
MKRMMTAALVVVLAGSLVATEVEARRLGSGGAGLRRPVPVQRAPQNTAPTTPPPHQQAAPNSAAQAVPGAQQRAPGAVPNAAAPAPRRSWLGPIAGIAAGLGLAALFSHLGLGAAFGEFVTLMLLVLLAVVVLRWLLGRRRPASSAPAMAYGNAASGAGGYTRFQADTPSPHSGYAPNAGGNAPASGGAAPAALGGTVAQGVAQGLDTQAVAEAARQIFLRLQQANDDADLATLRRYSTPEMAAAAERELQARGGAPQRTDVVRLDAALVDMAREDGQDVASVRFNGLIREVDGGVAEPFDELWHLVRPTQGGEWRLAGIQPLD